MTRQEITKTWAALRRYYPNSTRSGEETMLAYLSALETYPAAAVDAACKAYVQGGGRYWPDVADIVERLPKEAAANDQDMAMRRCAPEDVLGNIRAFAVVCGLEMPRGMTVAEAQKWRRAHSCPPLEEGA